MIIMDIDMPKMDGFSSVNQINTFLRNMNAEKMSHRICIHSVYIDQKARDKANDLGIKQFLKKPL